MIHAQENSQIENGSLGRPESCPAENQPVAVWTPNFDDTGETLVAPNPTFISVSSSSFGGHAAPRPPGQLRLHPALVRLKLIGSGFEINQAIHLRDGRVREHILITVAGTIISGFRAWHEAVSNGWTIVDCIEYSLSDEQALEFILIQHRPRRAWNNFNRVRLALELESYFQRRALANQIAGGKHKGSANLPKAEHIEVRQEIANVAGVSGRTVANVKRILKNAAPALIDALRDGILTINRALLWCSLPQWKQVEQFTNYTVERATSKIIRHTVTQPHPQSTGPEPCAILCALQRQEAQKPGSIAVRLSRRAQTVILLGQDLLSNPRFHTELPKP
jgi:hypothetical protein